MLDDPSKTTAQEEQTKTRLFLPAPPTPISGSTAPHTILSNHSTASDKQEVRLPLAIVLLSLVAITALVLGILFAVVPLLAQPKHSSSSTNNPSHVPGVSASTPPAADSTIVSAQGTTTVQGVSVLPTHFTVQSDCQPDNGYRCTITLYAAQNVSDALQWQASSDGITTKFNPSDGTIGQGQQQQVIVYIYDSCPYDGTLLFSIGDNNLTVPVHC